jgi:ribosomal protein S18 acetylase RimI-like enzyme
MAVRIVPATAQRWDDLAALFGRGVVKNCGCMWFRKPYAEVRGGWDDGGNVAELKEIVCAGREPGLLAYDGDTAIGWVSVAPRAEFEARLRTSRAVKLVPGDGVWSVLCFWVKPGHRGRGLAGDLLEAAVEYAREHGAAAVEGAPVDPSTGRVQSGVIYTGVVGMFQAAGFAEIGRRGTRAIYRLTFDLA